jgi:hypothetical protein
MGRYDNAFKGFVRNPAEVSLLLPVILGNCRDCDESMQGIICRISNVNRIFKSFRSCVCLNFKMTNCEWREKERKNRAVKTGGFAL